ncbi:magnesium and cobalt transport protein CorA [Cellulomonas sp. KRMCY2]|uniref:magnesium and cobalt transport protein CorA n=1 Tax=Cellulomonas sp. KRMCY2 TaxID=1304865 RepID=UPI00045EA0E9|nr:magnesium and cobalt transport protein CorA [Cellulomonas sp. KRMCY2]
MEQLSGATTWLHSPAGWREAPPGARQAGEVIWVRATDRADFAELAPQLGLPVDVVRDAGTHGPSGRHHRPHVEHLEGGVFLTAPTIIFRDSTTDVLTGEVTCLVLDGVVLTAETGTAGILDLVAERLTEPTTTDRLSAGVLSALLSALVMTASDVELALGEEVEELEKAVFSPGHTTPVERIYALKREIAEARRALVPLGTELPELVSDPDDHASADAWVRRLSTAVDRLDGRLDAHDDLLADMLSAHLALVSVRQNDDVRRISAWAAILAAPTLIASVYGMNFQNMPELGWPWAYPLVVGLMAAMCVALHRLFTRSGWL